MNKHANEIHTNNITFVCEQLPPITTQLPYYM